jgi:flagellum-specific peptidoglycan hydrolase FlgJ
MTQKRKQLTKEADQEIEAPYFNYKKTLQVFLLIFILFFLNVGAKNPLLSSYVTQQLTVNSNENNNIDPDVYPKIVRQRLHTHLVNEVENYIKYIAPSNKLDAEQLVTLCQKYDMDITFVLAQGALESHFGTLGKAVTTHSVFNVGAWDNGEIYNTYKNPNESIEPYLQLLNEEYLGDKKQISDLVKDGGFKNLKGKRYATSWAYESRLRTMMVHVDMNTSISMYQDVMNLPDEKILAYFSPIQNESDSTQFTALK